MDIERSPHPRRGFGMLMAPVCRGLGVGGGGHGRGTGQREDATELLMTLLQELGMTEGIGRGWRKV